MDFKISTIPYMGISFLAITQPFLTTRADNFYGNSRDYYLSIGVRNYVFDAILKNIIFWRENGRGRDGGAKRSGTSRPGQKVGTMVETFGSTVISKTCHRNFRA